MGSTVALSVHFIFFLTLEAQGRRSSPACRDCFLCFFFEHYVFSPRGLYFVPPPFFVFTYEYSSEFVPGVFPFVRFLESIEHIQQYHILEFKSLGSSPALSCFLFSQLLKAQGRRSSPACRYFINVRVSKKEWHAG